MPEPGVQWGAPEWAQRTLASVAWAGLALLPLQLSVTLYTSLLLMCAYICCEDNN